MNLTQEDRKMIKWIFGPLTPLILGYYLMSVCAGPCPIVGENIFVSTFGVLLGFLLFVLGLILLLIGISQVIHTSSDKLREQEPSSAMLSPLPSHVPQKNPSDMRPTPLDQWSWSAFISPVSYGITMKLYGWAAIYFILILTFYGWIVNLFIGIYLGKNARLLAWKKGWVSREAFDVRSKIAAFLAVPVCIALLLIPFAQIRTVVIAIKKLQVGVQQNLATVPSSVQQEALTTNSSIKIFGIYFYVEQPTNSAYYLSLKKDYTGEIQCGSGDNTYKFRWNYYNGVIELLHPRQIPCAEENKAYVITNQNTGIPTIEIRENGNTRQLQ